MGENIKNVVLHSGLSTNLAFIGMRSREDYERYYRGVWRLDEKEVKEEKKVNKFLEIKEGQEIDKIIDKFFDERKSIVMNDKIYKIILKAEQEIREIYKEEQVESDAILPEYITNENSLKIDKLWQERKEKEKKVKEKYAEVAALVEDIPAKDRIEIYKEYGILD